jgi:hypothetical protein
MLAEKKKLTTNYTKMHEGFLGKLTAKDAKEGEEKK